jgi:hypothetical protein
MTYAEEAFAIEIPVPAASDEVAAPARVFAPDQYAMFPVDPEPIEER